MKIAHSRRIAVALGLALTLAGFELSGSATGDDPVQHQLPQSQLKRLNRQFLLFGHSRRSGYRWFDILYPEQ